MRSFPWKEEGWSSFSMVEWIQKFVEFTLKPLPRHKRGNTFKFFEASEKHSNNIINLDIDNSATWQDLDLFCGNGESQNFVANVLDKTVTEMGTISFYSLLAQTTTDYKIDKS